jgi:hypothetical protein
MIRYKPSGKQKEIVVVIGEAVIREEDRSDANVGIYIHRKIPNGKEAPVWHNHGKHA